MDKRLKPIVRISGSSKAGFERIQVLFFLAILAACSLLLIPNLLKKSHAESDIRMKALLRAFHSANEAYRQNNPEEGYVKEITDLVHSEKKRRYLGKDWLNPSREGFFVVYQSPDLFPRLSFSLSVKKEALFKSSFCIDQQGVLRSAVIKEASEPLTADDDGCHGGIEVV